MDGSTPGAVTEAVVQATAALVGLAVPGYVLGTVSARGLREADASDREFIVRTAFGSLLVHVSLLWWSVRLVHEIERDGIGPHVGAVVGWSAAAFVVLPVVYGCVSAWLGRVLPKTLAGRVAEALGMSNGARHATAWSALAAGYVSGGPFCSVLLRDGRVITGFYGTASAISTNPNARDVFLERVTVAGASGALRYAEGNAGIWISGEDIVLILFDRGRKTEKQTTNIQVPPQAPASEKQKGNGGAMSEVQPDSGESEAEGAQGQEPRSAIPSGRIRAKRGETILEEAEPPAESTQVPDPPQPQPSAPGGESK